jgi:hypothetical protein
MPLGYSIRGSVTATGPGWWYAGKQKQKWLEGDCISTSTLKLGSMASEEEL